MIAFSYNIAVIGVSLGIISFGKYIGSESLTGVAAFLLLFHTLTSRIIPISRWIEEALIPEAICYGCGAVIELVNLYRCGCGFVSHEERHVFSPCPMCGKYFLWISCPECETSIPI